MSLSPKQAAQVVKSRALRTQGLEQPAAKSADRLWCLARRERWESLVHVLGYFSSFATATAYATALGWEPKADYVLHEGYPTFPRVAR